MNELNEAKNSGENVSPVLSEGVYSPDEDKKTPVERDTQTVKDDAQDYIFTSQSHKHRHHHHHEHGDEKRIAAVSTDELVQSTREPSKHHHHHHHRSRNIFGFPRRHHHHHHHHHHSGSKRRFSRKRLLLAIASVLLALIVLVTAVVGILLLKGNQELFNNDLLIVTPDNLDADVQDDGQYIVYKGETYKYNKNITSMLFMGVDKREMQETETPGLGGQSDVNVLMAMDFKKGRTTMFAIPRDIITDVAIYTVGGTYDGMEKMQLCLAYSYGDGKHKSCENQLATVRRIFYNVPVNSYFALDLDGIAAINDAVGGIDVTSPETIETFTEGESYHLAGQQAERFVRARSHESADANIARMLRQEIYAKSFMNTVISKTKKDFGIPVSLFNGSAPYSCTNLNAARITVLAKEIVMGHGMDFEVEVVKGASRMKDETHAEYVIDEEGFFEQFLAAYYEKIDKIE